MPNYSYTDVKSEILGDIAVAPPSIRKFINRAARAVAKDLDLRSTKRSSQLSPELYKGVYDYGSPADIKEWAIIDIQKQVGRNAPDTFELVANEEFDARKSLNANLITFSDSSFTRKLRISAEINSEELLIHDMEDVDGDGTWAVGGNGSDLEVEDQNFMNGAASLTFTMAAAYTLTTLTNSDMGVVDLTDFQDNQIFVWVYIPEITGLTNFALRIGSSSSDYYSKTVTTNNEGLAFYVGWNLLRFDLLTATENGTVDITAVDYIQLRITGDGNAAGATGWVVDFFVARKGQIHNVVYYSKYMWQTSAGVWLENSTADTDKINADTEELDLVVLKGKQILMEEDQMWDEAKILMGRYEVEKERYKMNYPSERMTIVSNYQLFDTIG